jgi:hypothetical protein
MTRARDVATQGGLTLIKTQTIGTAVSSVVVTGAFSATYDNYKIIVSGGVTSTLSDIRFSMTGSTSNYAYGLIYLPYGGSVTGLSSASDSTFPFAGNGSTDEINLNADVFNPFLAKHTSIKTLNSGQTTAGTLSGVHKVATSYTGFTLAPNTGTLTGATIYVYGYNKGA